MSNLQDKLKFIVVGHIPMGIYLPYKSRQRIRNEHKRKFTIAQLSKSMIADIQGSWYMRCSAETRVHVLQLLPFQKTMDGLGHNASFAYHDACQAG